MTQFYAVHMIDETVKFEKIAFGVRHHCKKLLVCSLKSIIRHACSFIMRLALFLVLSKIIHVVCANIRIPGKSKCDLLNGRYRGIIVLSSAQCADLATRLPHPLEKMRVMDVPGLYGSAVPAECGLTFHTPHLVTTVDFRYARAALGARFRIAP